MPDSEGTKISTATDKLYEFEQEPVSEEKLQPGKYFAGAFAGEHVAGTEFVIGATFVAWGVEPIDIFVGLLIGNALAVLTWTLVCAPIAVQTRLTLYWYLRRIGGPVTTSIYNVLNALLFMVLGGCMITVSASAVRIPFGVEAQTKWYPESVPFVLVVFVVGAVVTTLAILGFKRLAQFASVCSPWLFLMFIAGAFAVLPYLAAETTGLGRIESFADFWALAKNSIWKGIRQDGNPPLSFWHVAAFAWICNLAMHGGLSDMALLRYAKSTAYGLYSSFGMFLGHYLAWICAGVMGAGAAMMLKTPLSELDAGGVAYRALGISGIVAVVIAGWTTSNPTLYRAGLAFQGVIPRSPRWLVTLLVGIVTTVVASFPFVFTKLLDFVAYYGLLLVPVGAIVFTEHWIFPKIGLKRFWVSRKKLAYSWPALLSWAIAIAFAITLQSLGILHLFFLFIPVWFLTTILYVVFAYLAGAGEPLPGEDNVEQFARSQKAAPKTAEGKPGEGLDVVLLISRILAVGSLLACLVLPLWVFIGGSEGYEDRFSTFLKALIWPTLVYFITGTIWAVRRDK